MRVGCPKEIKNHEYRVGLTPGSVREYVAHGHEVLVEAGAGAGIGADDNAYRAAGATIAKTAADVFAKSDMIVKVKEPQPNEWAQLRDGQILYTYLHLAPDPEQTKGLLASGVTAIAYETVTDDRGGLPLLAPMSEVAGRLSIQAGATRIFRKPGDGEGFRDCDTCMDLVVVPAGRVTMQISIANASREIGIDLPRPFAVARHETTRGDFATFVRESGRVIAPGCHARSPSWRLDPALSWQSPGFDQGDDHPVVCVSFEDATAYAAWLSQKTGQRYRLPTDPEWHYLAAAERWLRRDSPQMCMIGNGADQSARAAFPDWEATGCTDGAVYTAPVGQFAAGLWGLHDLNGNVWEWVATCAPQPRADAEFPPRDCEAQAPRLLRGGSWADPPSLRMLDARIISAPAIRDQVAGFRLIREID